jgi:hypothetical protein
VEPEPGTSKPARRHQCSHCGKGCNRFWDLKQHAKTGQGSSHWWALEGISPSIAVPGPANQSLVFPHKSSSLRIEIQLRWLVSDAVGILGWRRYMWSVVVRPVGCTAKFSKTMLEAASGRELNIQLSGNSSSGYSCSQHVNCTLPQNLRHLWHCVV